MKDTKTVFIVTMPDGTIPEQGISQHSEDLAVAGALRFWFPQSLFGDVEWGHIWGGGVIYSLWPSMQKVGWKVQEVEIEAPNDR